ncbi:hypothetical protein G7047_24280 [Diaphorobacter sp. HDW4A]|uniref:hypothetical protein n=1 Tax=Diaphorobacter sp. HDW4A TaxID=2714924 RepID=UPI00140C709D|nr:hypothetical protein [Diaphorobacter sp. HDW4A]QIL82704.1 hypothetical protein G7047_24280 [Diaphorobacter sp. HDW4A]
MSFLIESIWKEYFKKWNITDCAVRDAGAVYLCLREKVNAEKASLSWDHDIRSQLFVLDVLSKIGDRFGSTILEGFSKPMLGVCTKPLRQGMVVSQNHDGQVNLMGGGVHSSEEFIDRGGIPATRRVKCINEFAYSIGDFHNIYKRDGVGLWVKLQGFPMLEASISQGFKDMDAFSESDMYAVGGDGDVWRFDGTRWQQQGFPSNLQLATVTCAGDGYVYISGEGGSLWRGRESNWELIYKGSASIMWNDVLWFENRLWLASDYQLRVWNGKEMISPTLDEMPDGKKVPVYGHMDARDGLLVVASPSVVMSYDGREWRTLVSPY